MDNHSIDDHDGNSVTNSQMECPCCKNLLTVKNIFKHLQVKHHGYFHQQTTKKWLEEAQLGKPLKVFWNKTNDFGEEETIVIFGCISSGKTFTTESRGIIHFKKNPNDLREHNKQIQQLLKTRNAALEAERLEKEQKAIIPDRADYIAMKKNNDPELCGALRAVVDNHMQVCEKLAKDVKEHLSMSSKVFNANAVGSQKMHKINELLYLLDMAKLMLLKNPTDFKTLSLILANLWHFLHLRKFFNGFSAPELSYPWFYSRDHPEGELSYGTSKFAKYIWPWDTPMNPIDNITSWIEI
jgi:hypothetical protein